MYTSARSPRNLSSPLVCGRFAAHPPPSRGRFAAPPLASAVFAMAAFLKVGDVASFVVTLEPHQTAGDAAAVASALDRLPCRARFSCGLRVASAGRV